MIKEEPEVTDENSDNEVDAEELQDKVKTQGVFKVEDEEQDLKVCELNQTLGSPAVLVKIVLLETNSHA